VWQDFFTVTLPKESFASPDALIRYLCRMAEHQVANAHRAHLDTDKRSVNRGTALTSDLADRQPGPEHVAAERDDWETRLRALPPRVQQALRLLRQGNKQREAAEALGVSERTLARMLERHRKHDTGTESAA
jgi:DNA-directed RNA polymerase specialized sigma24 family protein